MKHNRSLASSGGDHFPMIARGHGSKRYLYRPTKSAEGKVTYDTHDLRDCSNVLCRQAFDRTGPYGPFGKGHQVGSQANYQAAQAASEFGDKVVKAQREQEPTFHKQEYYRALGGFISTDGGKFHEDNWNRPSDEPRVITL